MGNYIYLYFAFKMNTSTTNGGNLPELNSNTKGLTPQSKMWAAYVAKEVKAKSAINPDQIFLIGRTLLDKKTFNKLNSLEDDVVHGVQVIYGPFTSKQSAHEFVTDYPEDMWPGDNDWRYIHAGQVEILSSYFDPGQSDIVHKASLPFQGQLLYNEQQRRQKEIDDLNNRLEDRKKLALQGEVEMSKVEVEKHIQWQKQRIAQAEVALVQQKKHLADLEKLEYKEK